MPPYKSKNIWSKGQADWRAACSKARMIATSFLWRIPSRRIKPDTIACSSFEKNVFKAPSSASFPICSTKQSARRQSAHIAASDCLP